MLGIKTDALMGLNPNTLEADPKIVVEPWMRDFVKARHTPEEWEAFMAYAQAGPWKRARIWLAMLFQSWWLR